MVFILLCGTILDSCVLALWGQAHNSGQGMFNLNTILDDT